MCVHVNAKTQFEHGRNHMIADDDGVLYTASRPRCHYNRLAEAAIEQRLRSAAKAEKRETETAVIERGGRTEQTRIVSERERERGGKERVDRRTEGETPAAGSRRRRGNVLGLA